MPGNIIAWVVIHFSSQPADREHPYGHRKLETLAVFILASILVTLAFELAVNTLTKAHGDVASSKAELLVMLCVLGINIVVTRWQHRWTKRLDSDILHADASHTFADVLVTITVIIGWQLSAAGYAWVDRLCALGVSLLIFYLAFRLFRRAVPVLIDEYAIDPAELVSLVKSVAGVRRVYRIRSRWIGKTRSIDLVIAVDPALSTEASHAIADNIEVLIEQRFGEVDVAIHVEPDSQA